MVMKMILTWKLSKYSAPSVSHGSISHEFF